MISIILAHDDLCGIGLNNAMPWHCSEDFAWFRQQTVGKTIVMGRKTFESLGSKPLPKRTNIVLTSDTKEYPCQTYKSIDDLLTEHQDFVVIGGNQIYQEFLKRDLVDTMIITHHHGKYPVDTHFLYPDMRNYERIEEAITTANTFRVYKRRRD